MVKSSKSLLVGRILFALAFIVLFFPIATISTGGGTTSMNSFMFIFGKKLTMDVAGTSIDVGSIKGSFGLIFLVLIPIGFEVVTLLQQRFIKLSAIILSIFGAIMSFALLSVAGQNPLIAYGAAKIAPSAILSLLLYIVISVFSIIVAVKTRTPKLKAHVNTVNPSETLKIPSLSPEAKANIDKFTKSAGNTALNFGKIAGKTAANLAEKAKDAAANVSNTDAKKAQGIAGQLKTYKDLLDQGIISQEDFDKKKAEILGGREQ